MDGPRARGVEAGDSRRADSCLEIGFGPARAVTLLAVGGSVNSARLSALALGCDRAAHFLLRSHCSAASNARRRDQEGEAGERSHDVRDASRAKALPWPWSKCPAGREGARPGLASNPGSPQKRKRPDVSFETCTSATHHDCWLSLWPGRKRLDRGWSSRRRLSERGERFPVQGSSPEARRHR